MIDPAITNAAAPAAAVFHMVVSPDSSLRRVDGKSNPPASYSYVIG
jgi:hypothetical protein